uniref:Uncharacterized protein n=1 Tax=Acrobeloides nanus TaxID=290746 RepID=A0A914DX44_9BILA
MDTTSADLASIVSLLQEGIALLSRIRGEWMMLCNFFEKVKIVLNEYLLKSIANFKKFAQKEKVQYMLREALKTVCLCVQISNAADIYTMIMDRHVIPELSKVGKELALTEHEAKSKLNELEGRYYAKEHQVTELIETKIREFNERAQEQMQEYATDLVEAHKTGFAQRALNFTK